MPGPFTTDNGFQDDFGDDFSVEVPPGFSSFENNGFSSFDFSSNDFEHLVISSQAPLDDRSLIESFYPLPDRLLPEGWTSLVTIDPSLKFDTVGKIDAQLSGLAGLTTVQDPDLQKLLGALGKYRELLLNPHAYCGQFALCGDSTPALPISFGGGGGNGGGGGGAVPLAGKAPLVGLGKSDAADALDYSFPYVVALKANDALACSGIYVGPSTILTAAHCICGARLTEAFVGSSLYFNTPTDLGDHATHPIDPDNYTLASQDRCIAGAEGEAARGPIDLGIIHTKDALDPAWTVFPLLATGAEITPPPAEAIAVGFGASEFTNQGGVKRYARLPLQYCNEAAAKAFGCVAGRDWVSIPSGTAPTDTCYGDSGGPLLVDVGGVLKLVGVTARRREGGNDQYCGSGGVYAAIAGPDGTTDTLQAWLRANEK